MPAALLWSIMLTIRIYWWLGGLVVRTSDSRLAVEGLPPGHDTAWLFISETGDRLWRVNCVVTATYVSTALHPSGVAKLSTSFGWGKGGKVTAAGWQVTLCDPIWHVISHRGVVKFTITAIHCLLYFTWKPISSQSNAWQRKQKTDAKKLLSIWKLQNWSMKSVWLMTVGAE